MSRPGRPTPLLAIVTFVTILLVSVLGLAERAGAECGAPASSCKACHEEQQQLPVNTAGSYHVQHAFGDFCADCHGGDAAAAEKDAAHAGMHAVTTDLKESCEGCHADYAALGAAYLDEVQSGTGASTGAATRLELPPPGSRNTLFAGVNLAVFLSLAGLVWAYERGPLAGKGSGTPAVAVPSPAGAPLAGVTQPPNPMARKRWSPYWAGAGLGLVGVLALWVSGQPLGSSGALMTTSSALLHMTGSPLAEAVYFKHVVPPQITWQLLLVIGIVLGALLSAVWSGDFKVEAVQGYWSLQFGPSRRRRWLAMFVGGAILEYGASLAGGCTSGLAIAGTMQLSGAGLLFIAGLFATGLITARLLYRGNY